MNTFMKKKKKPNLMTIRLRARGAGRNDIGSERHWLAQLGDEEVDPGGGGAEGHQHSAHPGEGGVHQ